MIVITKLSHIKVICDDCTVDELKKRKAKRKAENGKKCEFDKHCYTYEFYCDGWYKCDKCGGFLELDCDEQYITYKILEIKMKKGKERTDGLFSPKIINTRDINEVLKRYYSSSDIKRLKKQGAVRVAESPDVTYLRIGKRLFILTECEVAYRAMVWWEYHYSLKQKTLEFIDVK